MSEDLQFVWMILYLNSQKHFVLRFLYEIDDFRFGALTTLQISFSLFFSLPQCFIYLFLLVQYISQRIKSSIDIGCIDCNIHFSSLRMLLREKVCTWGKCRRLIIIFHSSSPPSPLTVVQRACSVAPWDILCHLMEFPWKGLTRGLNYALLDITWGIFSVLNITTLSIAPLLGWAI
jgi:hypothetical protein